MPERVVLWLLDIELPPRDVLMRLPLMLLERLGVRVVDMELPSFCLLIRLPLMLLERGVERLFTVEPSLRCPLKEWLLVPEVMML